ncbi:hypothetical protein [Pseudonocardia dioxanivorans]|nr:hypothetical protein [Pseudonocardia dioxanivorans]
MLDDIAEDIEARHAYSAKILRLIGTNIAGQLVERRRAATDAGAAAPDR